MTEQIIKLGRDIKPLDIVIIRGCQRIVESTRPGISGYNHLLLTAGFAWPVKDTEKLIYLGQAEIFEALGIPQSEM